MIVLQLKRRRKRLSSIDFFFFSSSSSSPADSIWVSELKGLPKTTNLNLLSGDRISNNISDLIRVSLSMNPNIWKKLPEHILEVSILPYLPAQTLLLFRSICRKWKNLIDSPSFLDNHHNQQSLRRFGKQPWLLMFKQQDRSCCRVYDVLLNKWGTLSLSFLRTNQYVLEVVSVSHGLICFRYAISGSLMICNPITKMWKVLYYKHPRKSPISMVYEPFSKSFKILITGSESDSFSTDTVLYDSITDRWKKAANLPFKTELKSEAPYCDGTFYFTTSEPIHILAYNISTDIWLDIPAPTCPGQRLTYASVAANGRFVFLIAGLGVHGIVKSLSIWKLHKRSMEWIEVLRMPDIMCKKFLSMCYHTYKHICCISHDDYICLFCSTSPEVLLYKISRGTWHWLPECPFLSAKKSGGFSWYSFDPDLRPFL